jgi:ribosomal protein S18 acetylase RimI-like enzyme
LIVDDVVLRPYEPGDDPALRAIRTAVRQAEGDVRLPQADQPLILIAEVGGTVAGFSRIDWWDEADGTRLYLLSGTVDPARRGRGVGRTLLAGQEHQALGHWLEHAGLGRAVLCAPVDENRPDVLALILAAGYEVRFTLVDLVADPATAPAGPPLPAGLELREVRPEHHPLIHAALMACFADAAFGQQRYSYDEYLDDSQDTSLWLIAWDGDDIAAMLITERLADGTVDTPWVAVLPTWRRKGVAAALLSLSLQRLAAAGITEARIRTVQENVNDTLSLYGRAGYRVVKRHPRYSKPMPA